MNKTKLKLQQFAPTQSIGDFVTAPALAAYWTTKTQEQQPYLGEVLFPNNKQLGMEISFIKGKKGAPVALRPSGFDVQAIPRNREGFERVLTEMINFKESLYVDEKQRQELLMYLQTGNQVYIDTVLGKIFDDLTQLVNGAAIRREMMRMELLTTGAVRVKGNGQDHLVDYGFDESHKGNAAVSWADAAASNPIDDIRRAMEKIEDDTGETPTRAIMNRSVFTQLRNNELINKSIAVFGNGRMQLSDAHISAFLEDHLGLTAVVYNKSANDGTGPKKLIPNNKFILLPEGELGKTNFGTTNAEADLMSSSAANVSIVDTGVSILTAQKVDPVNVETIVSMISLPTFEAMDNVYILETLQQA